MLISSLDGKILHLKEMDFIERMLFNEALSPDEFYKELASFFKKNNLGEKETFNVRDLESIDDFVKNYFNVRIEEIKTWLLRAYVLGRYLAKTDLAGTVFEIGRIDKLPKFVQDAAKAYNLSIEEALALQSAVEEGASLVTNTSVSTIETIRNVLIENIKRGGGTQSLLNNLHELITKDTGELNRDWMRVCFPAGTLIITKRGKVQIENINIGDEVITINSKFGKKVVELHQKHYTGDMYTIKTESGKEIIATAEHPIRIRRNGKNKWVPISKIKETDEVFGIEGYDTYYDKNWLYQKHVVEQLDCIKIAQIVNISAATIRENLHIFGIAIRKDLAFKGRKHLDLYKSKMKNIALKGKYYKRLQGEELIKKSIETRKRRFANGEISVWNKNKTKEDNPSIKKISNNLLKGF